MKYLVFENILSGHHLEFLHNYYLGAFEEKDVQFVFYVPLSFLIQKRLYNWPESSNIEFRFFRDDEIPNPSKRRPLLYALKLSLLLRKKIIEVEADHVLLTMLILFIPFVSFILPRGIRVRGIIYSIYLYSHLSFFRLAKEKLRFWLSIKSAIIEKVFVLNDERSAMSLNEIYKTKKFIPLPDPVPDVDPQKCKSLRERLKIPLKNRVFLHFGGLSERKGTINILKAISESKINLSDFSFIFAGKVDNQIRDDFYRLLQVSRQKAQIIVYDSFCPYELLFDLCYTCDILLMPYLQTNLSSGVLGYASVFRKCVIGPSQGLIGELIRSYDLGYCIDNCNPSGIRDSFFFRTISVDDLYLKTHSPQVFIDIVLSY